MKRKHMLFSLIVVYVFISSQMVLGQLQNRGLILGGDVILLLMNGEGKLGDMDLDVTRDIFSDDLEKTGFGWDNKSLFGIRPTIGYKIFPRLAFIGSYNYYFKKTVDSSEDISFLGFSSNSFAGELNASMEYSQKTIQLLGQFYPSTKLGLFLAAGIEFVSIKSNLTSTMRISDPVNGFSFQEDSKYGGSDNASGLIFGGGFELPLPIQNLSLQATALYSFSKYKGEDLFKPEESAAITDESATVEYDEQNSEMELGVGGLSASVGLRMYLFGSRVTPSKRESIVEKSLDPASLKKNSFGLGLGIPYGILGGNIDVNVSPNLNLSAGIGTTVLAGIGYNVGLKYFFTPIEKTFRPRISAYYGTNSAIEFIGGGENESYTGISLGIGAQWMWGKSKLNGLDFDIIYLASTGYDLNELEKQGYVIEEPGKVKISIGYRHAF